MTRANVAEQMLQSDLIFKCMSSEDEVERKIMIFCGRLFPIVRNGKINILRRFYRVNIIALSVLYERLIVE